MPLLRFKTGDIVHLTSKPCRCGKKGMRISTIYGRRLTTIRDNDGREYSISGFKAITKLWRIKDFQVIQSKKNTISLEIAPHTTSKTEIKKLVYEIRKHFFLELKSNFKIEVNIQNFKKKLLPCEQYLSRIKNQ